MRTSILMSGREEILENENQNILHDYYCRYSNCCDLAIGLAFVQVTHTPIEYFAGTVRSISIDDGMKIETVSVAPEFTVLPITGISLIVVGAVYALWGVEK